jgi:serine/threonine protein phosphatase PrpC
LSTTLEIEAFALTDVGIQRAHNEDALDVVRDEGLYIVADGMGGHASGQVASRLAVENLRKYVCDLAPRPEHEFTYPTAEGAGPPEVLLSNAIQWANERIYIESLKDRALEGMGTTIVCCLEYENFLVLGHVGDSRIYRLRGGAIGQVTRDHSLLNHLIDQGKLSSPEEIAGFRDRNIIVKALGLKDYVEPTVRVVDRQHGDIFVLCTDGLTDQVEDWIITNVIEGNEADLDAACAALVRLANDAGGKDNCTIMLLRVIDPEQEPDEPTHPGIDAQPDTDDGQLPDELPIDWDEDTAIGDESILPLKDGD